MGHAEIHQDAVKSCDPAMAQRPTGTSGEGPFHAAGGGTRPPGGAGAPQRPPASAEHLLGTQRES